MTTPRLDKLTAHGTDRVPARIRLADDTVLTVMTRPGADLAEEVFLFPGLTAPDTEAWENEDSVELFLTNSVGAGTLFLDVPVQAIRALIKQHSGEHEDQEGGDLVPQLFGETDGNEAADVLAARALAAWGITADCDGDAGGTWLDISRDQGAPSMVSESYVVLYLFNEAQDETTVTRPPAQGDHWRVVVCDDTGERTLMTRPVDQLDECAAAIAAWVTDPLPTAGDVLLAALADYGVTVHTDDVGMSYAIPLDPATSAPEVYNHRHLSVADRNPSVHHDPATHTGWTVFLHDENGEPVGDPLYIAGTGEPVDCAADSQAVAAFIADWLTVPWA